MACHMVARTMKSRMVRCKPLIITWVIAGAVAPIGTVAQQPLRVEEVWATKAAGTEFFGRIAGAVEAAPGQVIVSDEQNQALYALEESTGVWTKIARAGNGPGEVRHPTLLARAPAGEFAVYDLGGRFIAFYGADLREVRRVRLDRWVTNPKGFAIRSDGTIVLGGGMMSSEFGLHFFSPNGRWSAGAEPTPATEIPHEALHTAGGPVRVSDEDTLFYSNAAFHRIAIYPPAKTSATTLANDSSAYPSIVNRFYEVEVQGERRIFKPDWFHPQSRAIFPRPDARVLNIITRKKQRDSIGRSGARVASWWDGTESPGRTVPSTKPRTATS